MKNKRLTMLGIVAMLTGLLAVSGGVAQAATPRFVAKTGSDSGNCAITPCLTISYAIGQAVAGDTISVAAGTYNEKNITVNKSVTIIGDPGDSSPGPGVNAPVIDGSSLPGDAFLIANGVSNVTIKGFEIRNFTSNATGIGNGISAWVGSTSNITIQDNYFHDLGYNGVLVGNDKSSNPSKWGDHANWTIKDNIIDDVAYIGFELTNTSNSSIEDNVIHLMNPTIGAIFSSARRSETGLTIKNNLIDGIPSLLYPVIYVYAYDLDMPNPTLDGVLIEGNTIATTGTPFQIYIRNINTGTVTGVHVHDNNLMTLKNVTSAPIGATCNWWGTANGPGPQSTFGTVIFNPWLIASAPGGACFGGLTYTVTFNGNGSDGGSTAAQSNTYNVTANLTSNGFTKTGHTFAGWATSAGGPVVYADGASYTWTGNATLYAQWMVNKYTVTPSAGVGGSISPNTPQMVNYNQTTSFDVTATLGYHIVSVTGCGGTLFGNTFTTGLITAPCSVTANFAGLNQLKQDVLAVLTPLPSISTYSKVKGQLNEAIKHLNNSLATSLWKPGGIYITDDKVFNEEKDTVNKLMEAIKTLGATSPASVPLQKAITTLVDVDKTLAQIAINDAVAKNGKASEIAKAKEEMIKAQDENSKYHYDNAIDHFKNAWQHARNAVK